MDAGRGVDSPSPDLGGFDSLVRHKRERGLGVMLDEQQGRAEVVLCRQDWPSWVRTRSALVIIDRKRGGVLIGGRPRTFAMHPGDHTIAVRLGADLVEMPNLHLEPGERVELVCGLGEPRSGIPRTGSGGTWRWPKGKLIAFAYCVGAYLAATVSLALLTGIFALVGFAYPRTFFLIAWGVAPMLGIAAWVNLTPSRWLTKAGETPYLLRKS